MMGLLQHCILASSSEVSVCWINAYYIRWARMSWKPVSEYKLRNYGPELSIYLEKRDAFYEQFRVIQERLLKGNKGETFSWGP